MNQLARSTEKAGMVFVAFAQAPASETRLSLKQEDHLTNKREDCHLISQNNSQLEE